MYLYLSIKILLALFNLEWLLYTKYIKSNVFLTVVYTENEKILSIRVYFNAWLKKHTMIEYILNVLRKIMEKC